VAVVLALVAVLLVLAVGGVLLFSAPDIARYMRIKRM